MPDFFTDPQGRVRPITGKSGKSGKVVAATVLAVSVAAGGGALGGGAASIGGATESAVAQGLRAKTAKSRKAAHRGKHDEAWRHMGLRRIKRVARRELRCVPHSFGDTQKFFMQTPCRSLQRSLLAVSDAHDNIIAVSVAWVRMRNAGDATRLRGLVDTYGTGNITPIAGNALELQGIRFIGKHYDSRQDGALFVMAEATPVAGQPDPELMDAVAAVAMEFPPP
ncbi:hypothetical protein GCM10012275_22370 [Longimycelium tulufanense]|uniref:Uncharacterized protein n=1 Tax=Longimycelium tulufanense TaxID=907463 RepID=A0A8J3C7W6_9PSEU|nr:hypothetical protein GCM10012275_22370 [Longimycelium tulufanense]